MHTKKWFMTLCTLTLLMPSALADTVEVGGDKLTGTIVEETDTTVIFDHAVLGRLELPRDSLTSMTDDTPAIETVAPPPDDTWFKQFAEEWDISLDLSLNSSTGNTEESTLRFGFNANRITDDTRWLNDLSYYWKTSDNNTTDNKLTAGMRHDWLFADSPWFIFASGRYDYDEFQSWNQRINGQVGPGYNLIKNDEMTWDLLGGLGARKNSDGPNDSVKFEGQLGTDFVWKYTGRQSVEFNFYWFPVLDDYLDYRLRSQLNWRYVMDEDTRLSLLLGYLFEYASVVDPGDERDDLRIYAGLQIGF